MHAPHRPTPLRTRRLPPVGPGACGSLGCIASLRAPVLALGAFALAAMFPAATHAACQPDPPSTNGTIICTGTDETGYDASGANNVTIQTAPGGPVEITDADPGLDSAILVEDDSTVTIGTNATIRVTQQNGVGIRGDDDNFIENEGNIILEADDTRAIQIDQNTTGVLPNGAVNEGIITIDGDRSYGIESGDNSGVATTGTIEVNGNESRGLSGGSRTDRTKPANVTNSGSILVTGDDAYGMKFGDGWLEGTVRDHDGNPATPNRLDPSAAGIRNSQPGSIVVSGDRSFAIFAGTDTTAASNSLVLVEGSISVTGADSVGVSVGGNDLFDRFDVDRMLDPANWPPNSGPVRINADLSLDVVGAITGGANAGPLVVVRDFVADRENRIQVRAGASISADLANQGDPDRAIAVRGTDGDELIVNFGTIRGDLQLGGGNDRYVHIAASSSTASYSGRIDGGAGQDVVALGGARSAGSSFDVASLQNIETLRIHAGTPWRLSNGGGFTGQTAIMSRGFLEIDAPLTLGGNLSIADNGSLDVIEPLTVNGSLSLDDAAFVRVMLDGTTPPITVQGAATLDGTLIIRQGENLTPSATPYRVILANGRTGEFDEIDFPDASGTRTFTPSYDGLGVLALFQEVGLVGVAQGANQRAVAQHLDALVTAGGSQGDLQDFLATVTDIGDLGAVYDALSPAAYDAQTTVSVEAGRRIASMLFDRPRECRTGELDPWKPATSVLPCHARRIQPWAATIGSFRKRDGFDGQFRYDAQMGGLIAGVDFQPLAGIDLTLAVSSQRGGIDVARAGESTLTLAEVTGAAAWNLGGLRVQGAASYGHGFHQDRRRILFTGATPTTGVDTRGTEDHESDRVLVATEIGYRVPAGFVGIEPFAGIDWSWIEQDEISESGAGGFGLDVEERDDEVGAVRAGLRLSSTYEHNAYLGPWLEWMTGVWRPSFDVAWRQYLEGTERDLSARLQGGPDTVPGFSVQGEEDEGGAEIGIGFRLIPAAANRLRFDFRYQTYVAENTLEHDLLGQLSIAF